MKQAYPIEDGAAALAHLLAWVPGPDVPTPPLGRMIAEAYGHGPGAARTMLACIGVGVPLRPDGFIYLENNASVARDAFAGTVWDHRGWEFALRRLPGAGPSGKVVRFGAHTARATRIPAALAVTAYRDAARRLTARRSAA